MAQKKNNKKPSKPAVSKKTSGKSSNNKVAQHPSIKPTRKYKINKGLKLYNKISKDLTAYNNSLPPDKRIPYKIRRGMIKNNLYPHFKGKGARETTYKDIRAYIVGELSDFMIETGDVRLINPAEYFEIDYYDIGTFIEKLVPLSIDIRVNAGEFGKTNIFNTADYEYSSSSIPEIVDNIRVLEQLGSNNYPKFTGVVLVKPGRQEGKIDSYYLEFQLSYDGEAVPLDTQDAGIEAKQKKVKGKNKLENERLRKAKKTIAEKISKLTKKTPITKRIPVIREEPVKKEKPTASTAEGKKESAKLLRETNTFIANLKDLYAQGLISKKDMQAAMKKAINLQIPEAAPVAKKIPLGKSAAKPKPVAKKAVTKKRKK